MTRNTRMKPRQTKNFLASARRSQQAAMSLVELMVATALSSVLTLTLVQAAAAARNSFRLQESLAELQENSRYFADLLAVQVSDSGYHPQPWLHDPTPVGLLPDSRDAVSPQSDRLVVRSWTDRNCFGSVNPETDGAGKAAFYLRESVIELNNGSLALSCRFGPSTDELTTQVNRQGVIPQVETFQVLYARDADRDGRIDQWVRAGDWSDPAEVLAIRFGILSSSRESVVEPASRDWRVLDFTFSAPADGRLRRVTLHTLPLRAWLP